MEKIKSNIKFLTKSILNSYSIIFFSDNIIFSFILLFTSFFNPYAGLCGLLSVVIANCTSNAMGFNKVNILKGVYGFNSLLVGLGMGYYFLFNLPFIVLLVFVVLLTLFITIALEGVLGKYYLPFLSIPFLIIMWIVLISTIPFDYIKPFSFKFSHSLDVFFEKNFIVSYFINNRSVYIVKAAYTYLISLGAIFFQYNVLAGIVICIGLIIYSRIAFLLSVFGFAVAMLFYSIIGIDINLLDSNYIGFNFILTSIAIGGYFIIPSRHSFFWVAVLIPLTVIIGVCFDTLFRLLQNNLNQFALFYKLSVPFFHLSIYSLPFNIVVILFLYVLKFRSKANLKIEEVGYQHNSPEINLYSHINAKNRFRNSYYFPISLPFWGEWYVSQGHNGDITHRGEWGNAFDFVIKDDLGKTFSGRGTKCTDYYCYNKPIIAPADGYIENIVDNVEDNDIGNVNVNDNWGNTIIIRHANMLYSKICHIKKNSFTFYIGQYVRKGDIIGYCGNSGRSPEPHVHFQIQTMPFIGSKTLDYPINYFVVNKKEDNKYDFKQYDKPMQDEFVSNIDKNILISNAYHFIPGKTIGFIVKNHSTGIEEEVLWEVLSDYYNNIYFYCKKTNSKAYFYNDGAVHYFRWFEGNKKSLLYYFYLANYKVQMGFYKNLKLDDDIPIFLLNNRASLFLQDFVSPFYMFIKSKYNISYDYIDDYLTSTKIILKTNAQSSIGNYINRNINIEITLEKDFVEHLLIDDNGKIIEATAIHQ